MATTNNDGEGYYVGDTVKMWALYTDDDTCDAVLPTSISCTVYKPDLSNVVITWAGVDSSSAEKSLDQPEPTLWEFRFYFDSVLTGRHDYTIVASGIGTSVQRGYFVVYPAS
jgi:hypothetical protein